MLYISLFCFLCLGLLFSLIIKNKFFKFVFMIIFEFFFFLDLVAIITKATHIDYSFVANIEKSIISVMLTVFLKEVILMVLFIILFNLFIIKILRVIDEKRQNNKYKYLLLIVLLIIVNFSKIGVVSSIKRTANQTIFSEENLNIDDNLRAVGITPKEYITKDNIITKPGKNIVIIYLESLEKNYLDNELFDNITPNLNKLKEEWTFYDYQDNSGWTMGGMYTTQTGMLPLFGLQGNEIFQNITKTRFPSIGSVLNKAEYNQVFINGPDLSYSGMGNFFNQQEYECYGNKELNKNYPRTGWGVRDKELFEEAKLKYIELSKKRKPFNLSILTIDTHFPSGLPDNRMENLVKTKEKNMEYCVETTDYLIGNFIEFLKQQPNYKDLAIYILPDHRVMGNETGTPITKKLNKKPRDLFLLTNQKNIPKYEDNNKKLYFYDIPKIILNGANIKTNAKFLKDLIPNITIKYFNDKQNDFQNLNLSLVEFNSLKKGIKIEILKDGKVIFKSGKRVIDSFYPQKNIIKYYPVDENFNIKGNFLAKQENRQYKHELDYSNSKYILLFKLNDDNEVEILLSDYNKNVYLKRNCTIGKKLFSFKGYSVYKSGINISFRNLKRVLNNLILKNTLKEKQDLNSYFSYLKSLNDKNILVIISAMDEASNLYPLYKDNLRKLGSKKEFSNRIRWSYLGVFNTRGKKYLEKISQKKIDEEIKIRGNRINLVSAGFDKGNISSIKINSVEYSKRRRGLNIIVFDKNTKEVLDSFNVDTYGDKSLKIQR